MAATNLPIRTAAAAAAAGPASSPLSLLPVEELEPYADCYPDVNPMDAYRSHITSVLHGVLGVEKPIIYRSLQWSQTLDKGDMVLAVAALRMKGKKPNDLATDIMEKFPESALVEKPVASGPFLQFHFKPGPLTKFVIPLIQSRGSKYGSNDTFGLKDASDSSKGKKRIIVEFSSPNIAKPFHAGHLRSTIIGGFLANLYEALGWDVIRMNYLGDWGKQYGLLAVGFDKYGDEDKLAADPIGHLFEIYVKINVDKEDEAAKAKELEESGDKAAAEEVRSRGADEEARRFFKKMVDGDAAALEQWQRFRDLSITRYRATYARLNIHFDEYSGESQVPESKMEHAAQTLADKKISEESDGAVIVDFQKHVAGKPGKALERPLIRKRDGTALYLTRDISELLGRHEKYKFDKLIYVVASQQDLHLKQLFKIIDLMGHHDVANKVQHVNFGMVLGMSTRKGTVKFLDDILRDVADKMHEVMMTNEEKYQQVNDPHGTADVLGISSVMVQDMTGKRINNYNFNMTAMTSFEGDTGPYLQYAHARLNSITRKAQIDEADVLSADLDLLVNPKGDEAQASKQRQSATHLVRLIARYPDMVVDAMRSLEPCTILVYLFKMTHALSSSYEQLKVIGESDPGTAHARLALYQAARTVLHNGMRLLGLSPVERM